jgi:hypothetical protein
MTARTDPTPRTTLAVNNVPQSVPVNPLLAIPEDHDGDAFIRVTDVIRSPFARVIRRRRDTSCLWASGYQPGVRAACRGADSPRG